MAGQPITSIPNPYGAPGSTFPQSPPFAGNLSARYEFVFDDYRPFVQIGGQHSAHSLSSSGYMVNYDQPGFTTYDAIAGAAKDAWTVQAYCSNFTDTRAALSVGAPQSIRAITVNRPRTTGVKISY